VSVTAIKGQVPVEGRAPVPPRYSLIGMADVLTDLDRVDRGVVADNYPTVKAARWAVDWDNGCVDVYVPPGGGQADSTSGPKGDGVKPFSRDPFDAFTVLVELSASGAAAGQAANWQRMVARGRTLLAAVEPEAVEREFYNGAARPENPHLTSDLGAADLYPMADTAQKPVAALALLEDAIAEMSGQGGASIHVTPGALSLLGGLEFQASNGRIQTHMGTLLIPGTGYVAQDAPEAAGLTAATAPGQAWWWATSTPRIRRSEVYPDATEEFEAVDRSANIVTVRVERTYLIEWDPSWKVGVKVDMTL
jgi:hypothetical protein